MSLRKPCGEVGEGVPCVSVLLFGGSGGGGKMAAHGGSAASSALKGLIQQFTAITGHSPPPVPGLPFPFLGPSEPSLWPWRVRALPP
ncbi:hypothetical protein J1605_008260 [Eschrichtius robustus]|uniref:Uncharacterized protein n=1 Tax=Eschrichtius robustus TaxID=9764 RepID=A0AB34H095_ESCRO|nr:hypothetical protein J1605_008260 [Eschrichtius robustus]